MKRSPMNRGTSQLARTGFKRSEPRSLNPHSGEVVRKGMKRSRKRATVAEGSKYLEACRGEKCFLAIPGVCNRDLKTVVPCHSNQQQHGKGMGIKARHEFSLPGCSACHAWIDQGPASREYKFAAWDLAFWKWAPRRAEKMGLAVQLDEMEI
jgi:hypothetical protein